MPVLCTFGPPNERARHWMLVFEDADVNDMHFSVEHDAMLAFEWYSTAYTCTLFVTAEFVGPERRHAGLTELEMKAQASRCPCGGGDDYCVCQNVPDRTTITERQVTDAQREPPIP